MLTTAGPRLHVRGRVRVHRRRRGRPASPEFAALTAVLEAGQPALDAVAAIAGRDGREYGPAQFGPAVPAPARILCLGVNYSEHAIEGGRAVPTWPEAFVRGRDSVLGPYATWSSPR